MIDLDQAQDYYGYLDSQEWCAWAEETAAQQDTGPLAPLVAVVGGSGGVGRTTLATLGAALAADCGLETVLVEGDLQFGDLGFWLGLDDNQPSLAHPDECRAIQTSLGFELYKAPVFPEAADEVTDALASNLDRMRRAKGLVIADTGSYWSGYTANLLMSCDLFWMVVDQRPSSVAAAVKASELCSRLGVPSTRMIVVFNRWSSKCTLNAKEVGRALGVDKVCCVPEGRESAENLLGLQSIEELKEAGGSVLQGVQELLETTLPRVGCNGTAGDLNRKGLFK